MKTSTCLRMIGLSAAAGSLLLAPVAFGPVANAKPATVVKHCKVRPTSTGKLACSATNENGGGDPSLNPDNNRLPPSDGPNNMTESQKNQCFYACTHGTGALGAEACSDSCYGGR